MMIERRLATLLAIAALAPAAAIAAVATSANYSLERDGFGAGGGLGTSTSYIAESTVGGQATGLSTSTSYGVRAGYQQLDAPTSVSITVSAPSNVALSALPGLGGGTTQGSMTWTVTTDSSGGYAAYVRASTNPALQGAGGAKFANYVPATADPDYNFTVGATEAVFGVSAEGAEVVARFKDNGSICNAGTAETSDRCYIGLPTTDVAVFSRATPNSPGGSSVTLRTKAGVGASKIQDSGSYSAAITLTAYAQ